MTRLIKLTRSTECEDCGRILAKGQYMFKHRINDYYCHKCINKRGNPPETFGERLRSIRTANYMTQPMAAETTGFSQSMFTYWEYVGRIPRGENVATLARVFNTTSDYLLCLSDDPNRREDDEQ